MRTTFKVATIEMLVQKKQIPCGTQLRLTNPPAFSLLELISDINKLILQSL